MGAPRRIDQALHAVALGETRRRRATPLASIEEAADQARDRSNARIRARVAIGICHRDLLQRVIAAAGSPESEAAKIIDGGIDENERGVLAIELDTVAGTVQGGAAHLQAAAGARRKAERHRDAALRVTIRQRKQTGRESRNRAAKPLEIIKAMADEIAEETAAALAARLPAPEPRPRRLVFHVPGDHHVAQPSDEAVVQQRLGPAPGRQLRKVEIDRGRSGPLAGAG